MLLVCCHLLRVSPELLIASSCEMLAGDSSSPRMRWLEVSACSSVRAAPAGAAVDRRARLSRSARRSRSAGALASAEVHEAKAAAVATGSRSRHTATADILLRSMMMERIFGESPTIGIAWVVPSWPSYNSHPPGRFSDLSPRKNISIATQFAPGVFGIGPPKELERHPKFCLLASSPDDYIGGVFGGGRQA